MMQPQLIIVHDIHKAIDDVGVQPYTNTLVQDMGGEFWFVDTQKVDSIPPTHGGWGYQRIANPQGPQEKPEINYILRYRICPIPIKLAYFIIETLRLKAQFARLGVGNIDEPVKQAVYLTPGTTIFGKTIETLTEIPAEMRPVVVETL